MSPFCPTRATSLMFSLIHARGTPWSPFCQFSRGVSTPLHAESDDCSRRAKRKKRVNKAKAGYKLRDTDPQRETPVRIARSQRRMPKQRGRFVPGSGRGPDVFGAATGLAPERKRRDARCIARLLDNLYMYLYFFYIRRWGHFDPSSFPFVCSTKSYSAPASSGASFSSLNIIIFFFL